MPFCHGTEVLAALRSKPGPNMHTPVLFISGFIPEIPEEFRKSEQTFYLEKPIDFARFNRYVKMSVQK
jgi:CheY-like chemotaxis protein